MDNCARKLREEELDLLKGLIKKKQSKGKSNVTTLRCAIYARKSKEDDKDTSLPTQINYCKDLINGCSLLELSEVFQEDNKSGMWDDRPEFQRMIESIEDHKIDIVVVYKWDRFARKTSDAQKYYDKILKSGGTVIAGDGVVVINSAASLLVQQTLWNTGEYQARVTAERTAQILIDLAKQGRYVSGELPFGYTKNKNKVEVDLNEATIIYDIFEKISSGMSLHSVANELTKNGIRTRNGVCFTKQSLAYIVQNPFYIGTMTYNKFGARKKSKRILQQDYEEVIVENAHPAIVSKEVFNIVQIQLNNKSQTRYLDTGHVYLLSGLIKCKSCGHTLVGESNTGRT